METINELTREAPDKEHDRQLVEVELNGTLRRIAGGEFR